MKPKYKIGTVISRRGNTNKDVGIIKSFYLRTLEAQNTDLIYTILWNNRKNISYSSERGIDIWISKGYASIYDDGIVCKKIK